MHKTKHFAIYYTRHSVYSAYCNVQSEKCNVVFNKMYHAECILHLGFFIRHEMWYILLIAVFILHVAKCKSHIILCHVNTSSFYYYYAICTICKIQHAASTMQYYYIAYIIWNFEKCSKQYKICNTWYMKSICIICFTLCKLHFSNCIVFITLCMLVNASCIIMPIALCKMHYSYCIMHSAYWFLDVGYCIFNIT